MFALLFCILRKNMLGYIKRDRDMAGNLVMEPFSEPKSHRTGVITARLTVFRRFFIYLFFVCVMKCFILLLVFFCGFLLLAISMFHNVTCAYQQVIELAGSAGHGEMEMRSYAHICGSGSYHTRQLNGLAFSGELSVCAN